MSFTKGLLALDMDDPYVTELIKEEFSRRTQSWEVTEPITKRKIGKRGDDMAEDADVEECERDFDAIGDASSTKCFVHAEKGRPTFQWAEYERVDWDDISAGKCSTIWYMHRKGLIRKANLANTITSHISRCSKFVDYERRAEEEAAHAKRLAEADSDDEDSDDDDDDSDNDNDSDDDEDGDSNDEEVEEHEDDEDDEKEETLEAPEVSKSKSYISEEPASGEDLKPVGTYLTSLWKV